MSKVWKTIQKVTYAISGFSMFAVIILIFINSLCRYIFKYSIPWCEEMTRFMFIATIFFTLNIMVANKAALRVDILDNLLHGTAKFILERIIALLTLAALAVFTLSGISLVQAGSMSVSPSLRIPMYYVYALLPLGYFLALIETIRQEVLAIKEFCAKRKEENA